MLIGALIGAVSGALVARKSRAAGAAIGAGVGAGLDYASGTDSGKELLYPILGNKSIGEKISGKVDSVTMTEAQKDAAHLEKYGFERS